MTGRSSPSALAASAFRLQSASISGFGAMRTDSRGQVAVKFWSLSMATNGESERARTPQVSQMTKDDYQRKPAFWDIAPDRQAPSQEVALPFPAPCPNRSDTRLLTPHVAPPSTL